MKTIRNVAPIKRAVESTICHAGTPNGILAIIATGEVNGIIDSQNAIGPSGLFVTVMLPYIPIIKGKIAKRVNCWVSVSLSTAEPIAAYIAL